MKPWLNVLLIVSIFTKLVLILPPGDARALDNGLALTPPMGWNSWNTFRLKINEDLVKQVADVMVAKGFKDAGYRYVVIDDGWQITRDEQGNIVANRDKFPSGIKSLADYIHSKGLKVGIYSDAGTLTCAASLAVVAMNTRTRGNTPPGASTI